MHYPLAKALSQALVPPEWYALTLAEYLEACAEDQAKVISTYYENLAVDGLDEAVEVMTTEVDNFKAEYSSLIQEAAAVEGIDLTTVDRSSAEFLQFSQEVYDAGVASGALDLAWYERLSEDEKVAYHNDPYNLIIAPTTEDVVAGSTTFWTQIDNFTMPTYAGSNFDAIIPLGNGYVKERDLRKIVLAQVQLGVPAINIGAHLRLDDYAGVEIPGSQWADTVYSQCNPEGAVEMLTGALASCYANAGAMRAMTLESVSDRLSYFNSYVDASISGYRDRFTNVIGEATAHVRNIAETASDYVDYFLDMTGISDLMHGSTTPDATDFAAYTGATPIPCINIHVCSTVAGAVGAAVLAVGWGVFQAGKALVKHVGSWFKKVTNAITAPQDIDTLENPLRTHRGVFDTWEWTNFGQWSYDVDPPDFVLNTSPEECAAMSRQACAALQSMLRTLAGNDALLSMKTWGGEMMIQISSSPEPLVVYNYPTHEGKILFRLAYQTRFKPYVIDVGKFVDFIDNSEFRDILLAMHDGYGLRCTSWFNLTWTEQKLLRFGNLLTQFFTGGDAYYQVEGDDADKNDAYVACGLYCGYAVHVLAISSIAYYFSLAQNGACGFLISNILATTKAWATDSEIILPIPDPVYTPEITTNKDIVMAATGWIGNSGVNPTTGLMFESLLGQSNTSASFKSDVTAIANGTWLHNAGSTIETKSIELDKVAALVFMLLLDQRFDRNNPDGDWVFVPYSNGHGYYSPADYRVRTDKDNVNVATALWVVIGAAVITVAARLAFKIITRAITRKKFFKWTAAQGRLDNAMWNGKTLTRHEQRIYRKAQRKLGAMSAVESIADNASASTLKDKLSAADSAVQTAVPMINGVFGTDFSVPSLTAKDPSTDVIGIEQSFNALKKILIG